MPGTLTPGPAVIIAHAGEPTPSRPSKTLPALVEQFEERQQSNEIILEVAPGEDDIGSAGRTILDFIVEGEASAPVNIQQGSSFLDVPAGHWASDATLRLANSKIANGYPNGTFHPEAVISRQELAVLLAKTANLSPIDTAEKRFADVGPHSWSTGYINSVVKAGYLDGTGATLFDPQGKATRAQVIKAIINASPFKSRAGSISPQEVAATLSRFSDVKYMPEWAKKHLAVAVENGLVGGYPTGELRPNVAITRAEVSRLLVQGLIETK
ncbi:S-layer homology domain-containing protein [Candidatus Aquicultor sp.]